MDDLTLSAADAQVTELVELLRSDEKEGLRLLDAMLVNHKNDPRLYFLQGSFLAGGGNFPAAIAAMRHAVDLAPGFDLARFQLGFLLLTSNQPYGAQEAWGPLHGLPGENYLRLFVEGLCHLIRDEFDEAVAKLGEGIAKNSDNMPLNADIRLIIEQIGVQLSGSHQPLETMDEPVSAAQMLLQQASLKSTRH